MNLKQIIFNLIIVIVLFTSCQTNKEDIVNDLLLATNSFDSPKINQLLSDKFIYIDHIDTLNKKEYITRLDSLKNYEFKSEIILLQNFDTIIKTEERVNNIIDSLLDITPKITVEKTYSFFKDKIRSITIDSILNKEKYSALYNDKMKVFLFYLEDQYDILDENEILKNIKKYLTEYNDLSILVKKKYKRYSSLQGVYVSNDNPIYEKLIFKGKKTVVVIDAIFGMQFSTSYELDDDYIKIRTDKSDLLLQIKDSKTLIGEGFASGTYNKTN